MKGVVIMSAPKGKEKLAVWMYPEIKAKVKEMYRQDDCRSMSEFVEKSIRFYVGYGSAVMLITLFNSLTYRSLAAIEDNKEIKPTLKARANLLFINTAIMLVSVVISLTVLPYCSIIGIVIISITFMLPIFKK